MPREHRGRSLPALLLLLALPACGGEPSPQDGAAGAPGAGHVTDRPVILTVGTSLTAGLGLDREQAWPAVIQRRIDSLGLGYEVINAGVSGETSAGARARLDWLLRQQPAVLVLETGANDGLRGQDPDSLRANLLAIIERIRAESPGTRILLLGMEAPRNWGGSYVRRFRAAYHDVARTEEVAFVPFFLEGVAGVDSLNQADGIHPTASGQRRLAEAVWPALQEVIE